MKVVILNGSKKAYEVTGESSGLTRDIEKFLEKRKISMMYRYRGVKVLSDRSTDEINNVTYKEMIVKRGSEYACISYIKGSTEPPDVLVAYPRPEKFKKHV